MSDCALAEALEDRCYRLEGLLGTGYSKNADVSVQLERLYAQLHDIYFQGQKYSQDLLQLLSAFMIEDTENTCTPDDVLIFTSCFDDICTLYSRFDELNDQYKEFCEISGNSLDQISFKDAKIQTQYVKELPELVYNCDVMILRSIATLNRFIDWNIEVNGFFQSQKKRLLNVQKLICST
ncbi:YLL049W [Saccharomyces arboricola H-6]|uniref:YLL049W n=1 Tax=Saccharomyces arboricola (strain H-6 / AS 2.3317 / CBS 10644) TaxID=1160507 RepID=J8Q2D8_SACAR|nr:YLL049W [Saccharomyces arboricola H-6]